MTLDATQVWNTARTLRLSRDLPFLWTIAHESGQKWDNLSIYKAGQDPDTGPMIEGCILDQHYASIIVDCPKLIKVERLLRKHSGADVLILSHCPKGLLVLEQVSPSST